MTVEQLVITYLGTALTINSTAVPVHGDIPANPPEVFVTVEKTGSREHNKVKTATLAVQSWAGSRAAAAELNELVKAAMAAIITRDDVSACRCESDYNYTDTSTKRYRYQAVFSIVYFL